MKIIKSSVDVLEQSPGIEGMYKQIELIGRLSHKSEDRITDDSYIKFIDMMRKIGHYAVFNMGTVYLRVPIYRIRIFIKLLRHYPFARFRFRGTEIYVTTDYRVIVQEGLESEMERYWSEPTEYHHRRLTAHFICSRAVSHELVRHASLRPMQESTRYCNYGKDKFGGITYILPQWIYGVRDEIGSTIDSLTGEDRCWIYDLDGEELWNTLCLYDRTVASRDKVWKICEDEYLFEINTEESYKLRPEDARGELPHDLKTELYMCGFESDWFKVPKTKERTGFFYLRSDESAHLDVRVLSIELEKLFRDLGYGNCE